MDLSLPRSSERANVKRLFPLTSQKYELSAQHKNPSTSLEVESISELWLNTRSATLMQWTLGSMACYNCGKEGHFTKNCPKPINTCSQCKWLGGNHKKGCKKSSQDTHEVHMSWDDNKSISSDNEHEVHKASKGNGNGKGHDLKASIKDMNFDKAYAWLRIKRLSARSREKPKPEELFWVFQGSLISE